MWNDDEPDDKALEAARMEAQVFGGPNGEGETPLATLRRLFEENSIKAGMQIINLSNTAMSERIRLDASKYIVERVMGPMTASSGSGVGAAGSLEHALEELQKNMSD